MDFSDNSCICKTVQQLNTVTEMPRITLHRFRAVKFGCIAVLDRLPIPAACDPVTLRIRQPKT
jgi:hypothetical protein